MYETTQKILKMSFEEFKIYKVPEGWKLIYVSGHGGRTCKSANPKWDRIPYFEMTVTIEEEK